MGNTDSRTAWFAQPSPQLGTALTVLRECPDMFVVKVKVVNSSGTVLLTGTSISEPFTASFLQLTTSAGNIITKMPDHSFKDTAGNVLLTLTSKQKKGGGALKVWKGGAASTLLGTDASLVDWGGALAGDKRREVCLYGTSLTSTAEAATAGAKAISLLPVKSFSGVNMSGKKVAHVSGHAQSKSRLVVKPSAEQLSEASDTELALFLALAVYPLFEYRDSFTGGKALPVSAPG